MPDRKSSSNLAVARENARKLVGVVRRIASVLTIITFVMYLQERRTRKLHDTLMLGFLHGIKPLFEILRDTTAGTNWQSVINQINDMLSRLQPQPPKHGK